MAPVFPTLSLTERLALLEPPHGPISLVLDTDTYNEIDDQFALVYALLSRNLVVEAVYAAPFLNERAASPGDGMEKSYEEILRVLSRLGHRADGFAFRGSTRYLPSADEPERSPAAVDLVERAMSQRDGPLYVVAIGALSNIASALLLEPEIIRRIVVVWLGGEPWYWNKPMTRAFNLWQDVAASQIVFDSGVPLVHVPCTNVAEHLRTTLPEMAHYVKGQGAIGDYLYEIFHDFQQDHFAFSKVIWDLAPVAYLNHPDWVLTELRRAPLLGNDLMWQADDPYRHMVREAVEINRDFVFADLFRKLSAQVSGTQVQPPVEHAAPGSDEHLTLGVEKSNRYVLPA